ncbi:MAG: hypothetical protein AB2L12_04235 [Smithellaceae bacterium]
MITSGIEKEIIADAAFMRRHILDPHSEAVKGYLPVMPKIPVTDEELNTIIIYLETIK